MPIQLWCAPASAGKSAWLIDRVRAAAAAGQTPLVVVATARQAQQLRQRLAEAGGALGVHFLTFDELIRPSSTSPAARAPSCTAPHANACCASPSTTWLTAGELSFYAALVARPGFIAALEGLHLRTQGRQPAPRTTSAPHWRGAHAPPRLTELAAIFARYEELLTANGWTDRAGLGALALAALQREPLTLPWAPVIFDGFDSFTVVQREVIAALATHIPDIAVLLTSPGAEPGSARPRRAPPLRRDRRPAQRPACRRRTAAD
jgi:hypothetical protein